MTNAKRVRTASPVDAPGRSTLRRLLGLKSSPIVHGDELPDPAVQRGRRVTGKGRRALPPHRVEPAVVERYSIQGKSYSVRVAVKQKGERRALGRKSDRLLVSSTVADAAKVRSGAAAQRLRELQADRRAAKLIDRGEPLQRIADELGVPLAAAERLRLRRALLSTAVSPEEVVLRRAVGRITDDQMMRRLLSTTYTSSPPPRSAWFDSATPSAGTAKQLMQAYQDRLLTRYEYERLSSAVKVEPVRE